MASSEGWTPERARALLRLERPADIHLGLDRLREVLGRLDAPHRRHPAVIAAGTNGKGSTCAFLDASLRACGLRVGLYTSPHLVDWPERIRVNGEPISWTLLARSLGRVEEARAATPLTTFERLTAAAFLVFAEAALDLVILEVGLGGRLDATRVVRPVLSLLTPIGLDHRAFLGDTIAAVAREKAGVLEPGSPALTTASGEALDVLQSAARERGVVLSVVPAVRSGGFAWRSLRWTGLEPGLRGTHQQRNLGLALAGCAELDALGLARCDPVLCARAVAEIRWPGRLQLLATSPDVLLDGAHNPHAARALAAAVREGWAGRPVHLLFGALADKDVAGVLDALLPLCASVTFVDLGGERSASPEELRALAGAVPAEVASVGAREALERLRVGVPAGEVILATGSLRLVGEVLRSRAGAAFW